MHVEKLNIPHILSIVLLKKYAGVLPYYVDLCENNVLGLLRRIQQRNRFLRYLTPEVFSSVSTKYCLFSSTKNYNRHFLVCCAVLD